MKYFRFVLFPFAMVYGLIVRLRNHLYNTGHRTSVEFDLPVICVGNLVAGGSGKTPMVEYLVRAFDQKYNICTLSRGYGRKIRGFKLAGSKDNHLTIGDEPFQIYRKFGDTATVAVGEERALAIPEILFRKPEVNLIILDDAYQHRAVKASVNILLTEYSLPFYKDYLLPAGMLREPRKGAERADFVVVTKCPENLLPAEAETIKKRVLRYAKNDVPIFFSAIKYSDAVNFAGEKPVGDAVVALTGIANPKPFLSHLEKNYNVVDALAFPDHHRFDSKDVEKIIATAKKRGGSAGVVTTEKDYVRLLQFEEQILRSNVSFLYVPIVSSFLFEENKFDKMLSRAIIAFERKNQ